MFRVRRNKSVPRNKPTTTPLFKGEIAKQAQKMYQNAKMS
jgi:hypothetical protein